MGDAIGEPTSYQGRALRWSLVSALPLARRDPFIPGNEQSQQTALALRPMLGSWVLTCMEGELLSPCYKTGSQITHKPKVLRGIVLREGKRRSTQEAQVPSKAATRNGEETRTCL